MNHEKFQAEVEVMCIEVQDKIDETRQCIREIHEVIGAVEHYLEVKGLEDGI